MQTSPPTPPRSLRRDPAWQALTDRLAGLEVRLVQEMKRRGGPADALEQDITRRRIEYRRLEGHELTSKLRREVFASARALVAQAEQLLDAWGRPCA